MDSLLLFFQARGNCANSNVSRYHNTMASHRAIYPAWVLIPGVGISNQYVIFTDVQLETTTCTAVHVTIRRNFIMTSKNAPDLMITQYVYIYIHTS